MAKRRLAIYYIDIFPSFVEIDGQWGWDPQADIDLNKQ